MMRNSVTSRQGSLLLVAAFSLLLTSCFDTIHPLSDPHKSKPDDRLLGIWRFRAESGETSYCHVGSAGEKFPASVMRIVVVRHTRNGSLQLGELLVFPSTLGDATYLNVADTTPSLRKRIEETGWTDEPIFLYQILRYQISEDALTVQLIDGEAKKRAIEAEKIKGMIEKDRKGKSRVHFTDTSENLAKFVAESGDDLFSKQSLRLERVK